MIYLTCDKEVKKQDMVQPVSKSARAAHIVDYAYGLQKSPQENK
jgi:hypothetical protein